jgi:ring-1,2-phenylacetyl-CoA epoxidase subunit PaaA
MAKVQDEAGHGLYLYSATETLGVHRAELLELLHSGKQKYSSISNHPTLTWADVGAIGWLVDGATITNQVPQCRGPYGPYARAMVRIVPQLLGFGFRSRCPTLSPAAMAVVPEPVSRWFSPAVVPRSRRRCG